MSYSSNRYGYSSCMSSAHCMSSTSGHSLTALISAAYVAILAHEWAPTWQFWTVGYKCGSGIEHLKISSSRRISNLIPSNLFWSIKNASKFISNCRLSLEVHFAYFFSNSCHFPYSLCYVDGLSKAGVFEVQVQLEWNLNSGSHLLMRLNCCKHKFVGIIGITRRNVCALLFNMGCQEFLERRTRLLKCISQLLSETSQLLLRDSWCLLWLLLLNDWCLLSSFLLEVVMISIFKNGATTAFKHVLF